MAEEQVSLNAIMASLAELKRDSLKKEDIAAEVRKEVNQAIDAKVTKKLKQLDKKTDNLEERLVKLEQSGSSRGDRGAGLASSEDFLEARKSVRLSPCSIADDGVQDFLVYKMDMPEEIVATLDIANEKEIFPRKLPSHRVQNKDLKVQVEFESIEERDLVMSYAINLKNPNNIEIVIPDRLKILGVKLEHFAYRYRNESKARARGNKNKEAKTQLRLDNESESLVLGIRERKDKKWNFYTLENLPKLDSALPTAGIPMASDE